MKDKRVEVPAFEAKGHAVGDEVEVALRASLGLKAVWISYMIPLLLLIGVVLALTAAGWKELAAGAVAVAAVALYYGGLWLVRDRIARKYEFYLK
jgi:sigma-E factor negative regulatory protein RseC